MARRGITEQLIYRLRKFSSGVVLRISYYYSAVARLLDKAFRSLLSFEETAVVTRDGIRRTRVSLIQVLNPFFWVLTFCEFLMRYLASRPMVAAVQGLPTLLVAALPLAAGLVWLPSRADQIVHAKGRVDYFLDRDKQQEADYFSRKLMILDPDTPKWGMVRVQVLDAAGDSDAAWSLALQIAAEQHHVPAALWLCRKRIQQMNTFGELSEHDGNELVSWLNSVLQQNPRDFEGNLLLGSYHMLRRQYTTAIAPLRLAFDVSGGSVPEAAFSLALVLRSSSQDQAAIHPASAAANGFLLRIGRHPNDIETRRRLVSSLLWAAREAEAVRYLTAEINLKPAEKNELGWALAESYALWSKRLSEAPRATPSVIAESVAHIYRAISIAPTNPVVMEQFVRLTCRKDFNDEQLDAKLELALASGASPGIIHFIIGTRLLLQEMPDETTAMEHLRLAQTHDSNLPGLMNNLAHTLITGENPNPNQADILIENALRIMPNEPYFYETRGRIRRVQGRYLEAVADFEKALTAEQIRIGTHELLADVYTDLGNDAMVQKHRSIAAYLSKLSSEGGETGSGGVASSLGTEQTRKTDLSTEKASAEGER